MKRRILLLLFILALLLLPPGVILAQTNSTTVTSGETVNDDVVLFEGDLAIEDGATVNGDVTLFSGDATIAGTVNGNVVLFDGELVAEETAVFNGDCIVMSGNITDYTSRGLACTNFSNVVPELSGLLDRIPLPPSAPSIPGAPTPPSVGAEPSGAWLFLGNVFGAVFRSLFLGVIAFAVATLFPQHLHQVRNTVREKPIASGTVGFLTGLAVPFLIVLVTPVLIVLALVCGLGILLAIALALGFAGAMALGWFAVGNLLGQRMSAWLNLKNRTLPVTTAVGTITLTLMLGLLGAVPFVFGESLAGFIISCIGLGAVALTKFGTRAYPLAEPDIRILTNQDKVTAVLNTLPDDVNSLK